MSDETRSAPPAEPASVGDHVTQDHPLSPDGDTGTWLGGELPDVPGYAVSRELVRGGMGVVCQAVQTRLNRPVAIKLVLSEDRRGLVRFLAEADAAAAVQHPQVRQVFDFGEHRDRPYLAMEFCPGGTLPDKLAGGQKLPTADAARLIAGLAEAVQAAHKLGIVQRDFKPGNILYDAAGTPKVADFGLAKRDDGSDLTATQAVMGTPAYMSPEQAKGDTKFVGPAADVWALGVMLYESLTVRRPFVGDSGHVVMMAVMETEPARPRALAPAVPRDLELVCQKCLRKPPHERYATAGELAADLRRFLASETVTARPVSAAVRLVKWAWRKPVLAGTLAALAGVTVGLFAAVRLALEQKQRSVAKIIRKNDNLKYAVEAADKARRAAESQTASAQVDADLATCEGARGYFLSRS